ncbi:hypothetical protein [Hydrogenophaga sp.]|uniref:hypothetical protein n=1 Tax=Hydrogenophaga sp. TaxID=1904254 RepID=UPI00262EDEE2|nr:hypothetical protein [Hydrogenophaga sp.]MCW5655623.1 hypothetical protein [Hydrogenophaga sp.]
MRLRLFAIALASVVLLAACGTQRQVAAVDPNTGRLVSEKGTVTEATVVTSHKFDLPRHKQMAFVSGLGNYGVDQLRMFGYFDQVVSYDDLQKIVISNRLQEQVPSLNEPIGLSKLYRAYKPFLWVHFKRVERQNKPYLQLVASNPDTLDEVFVAEVHMDFVWAGVTDQNARYPLFNAFNRWVQQNK